MALVRPNERRQPSTVEPRHVQVGKDEAGLQRVPEALDGVSAVDRADDRTTDFLEAVSESVAKIGVVIDHENAATARHRPNVSTAAFVCHHLGWAFEGVSGRKAIERTRGKRAPWGG